MNATLTIHFGPFIPEQIEELREQQYRIELQECRWFDLISRIRSINSVLLQQVSPDFFRELSDA